jgi:hypothetical protein
LRETAVGGLFRQHAVVHQSWGEVTLVSEALRERRPDPEDDRSRAVRCRRRSAPRPAAVQEPRPGRDRGDTRDRERQPVGDKRPGGCVRRADRCKDQCAVRARKPAGDYQQQRGDEGAHPSHRVAGRYEAGVVVAAEPATGDAAARGQFADLSATLLMRDVHQLTLDPNVAGGPGTHRIPAGRLATGHAWRSVAVRARRIPQPESALPPS